MKAPIVTALCRPSVKSVFGPVGPSLMRAVSSSPTPDPPSSSHTFLPPNRKRDAGRVQGDAVGSGTRESYLRLRVGGLEVLVLSDPPFLNTGSGGVGGGRTGGMNYKNITAEPDLAGKQNAVGSRRLEINIALDQADAHARTHARTCTRTHTGLQN